MRVAVVTIVHHPLDARIYHREIAALLDAGHTVTYIAPWRGYGVTPPANVDAIDVPRAAGRDRLRAVLAARKLIAAQRGRVDVVLLHDPELVGAIAFLRRPPTVWDVHEDTAADLVDKPWLPSVLRAAVAGVVHVVEKLAERRLDLILAETGYTSRFARPHVVVPNEPVVPERAVPPGEHRVIYVGRVSKSRGAETLLALAGRLPDGVRLEVIGPADADVEPAFRAAAAGGTLDWDGFVPNDQAHQRVNGAVAGVSLLRDLPNFRHSRPTKVVEYMARGVPVITTPIPVARELVEANHCGLVVPFDDVDAVVVAIEKLRRDGELRSTLGANGHAAARAGYDWARSASGFVGELERVARRGSPRPS